MADRVLPKPDAFATCPNEGKVLEYYTGTFEAVYILLHPFIDAAGIGAERFGSAMYPTRQCIVKNCRAVPWAEVMSKTGLPSLAAVDIGLRTIISGLKSEFANQEYASAIESLTQSCQIVPPPEGYFSDLLHDSVLTSIQNLGYEWAWVGNEFGTERKLHWIDDLKNPDSETTSGHVNVFTPDKALLWTAHWDSHFSFLCSSAAKFAAMQNASQFEGFFCDPGTEVYWSVRV
jgi:hypothetical protein